MPKPIVQRKVSTLTRPYKRPTGRFIFGAHQDKSKYVTRKIPYPDTKTIIIEHAIGTTPEELLVSSDWFGGDSHLTTHEKRQQKFIFGSKAKPLGGEQLRDRKEAEQYRRLLIASDETNRIYRMWNQATNVLGETKLEKFKEWIKAFSEREKFRNQLIQNTILKTKEKGPFESRYGLSHTQLYRFARRNKIDSQREMLDLGANPLDRIFNKINSGRKITEQEWVKAYIEENIYIRISSAMYKSGHLSSYDISLVAYATPTLARLFGKQEVGEIMFMKNISDVLKEKGIDLQPRTVDEQITIQKKLVELIKKSPGGRRKMLLLAKIKRGAIISK